MPKNNHRYSCSDSSSCYSSDEDTEYTCKKCEKKKDRTCKKCEKKKEKPCKKCQPKKKSCSKCEIKVEEDDEEKTLDICDAKKNGNYIIITIK